MSARLGVGIHDISEGVYHADPAVMPSLTASVAKVLLSQSPRHAWHAHPRLNPSFEADDDAKFDMGTACHALLLQRGKTIQVVDAEDWRTNAAKQARDDARNAGKTPLLRKQYDAALLMAQAAREQIKVHEEAADAFLVGTPEQTLIWTEVVDGFEVWCRARLDWLPPEGWNVLYDYKTTGNEAHPDAWGSRTLWDTGADIQAAFYARGFAKLRGLPEVHFRFVVQETFEPHALCVHALAPAAMAMAQRKVDTALRMWAWAMRTGRWTAYPRQIAHVNPPSWIENRWLAYEERDSIGMDGKSLIELGLDWQTGFAAGAHPPPDGPLDVFGLPQLSKE